MLHQKMRLLILALFVCSNIFAQYNSAFDYSNPKSYEIGGLQIEGTNYLDPKIVSNVSGLVVGDKIKIPGTEIAKAIKALWKQNLFSDVKIEIEKTIGDAIFLKILVTEKPRLSRYSFQGVRKGESEDLKEKLSLIKGRVITEDIKVDAVSKIKDIFVQKGFPRAKVQVIENPDTLMNNSAYLIFKTERGKRTKINEITFDGVKNVKKGKLKRLMKKTKTRDWWTFFSVSKFNKKEYEEDKERILEYYHNKGYKDATIENDSVYLAKNGHMNVHLKMNEGKIYYLRNILWKGNVKYDEKVLNEVFGLKKGDVYNQTLIDSRLYQDQSGRDITSLYMDEGHLFFRITPIEAKVENDSIDLEIKIFEGPQATVRNITIVGNTRTHEHVIRREIRTKPGQKFSRSDIIRSQRELANLGYFNPEGMGVQPKPNPENGTVDIEYKVDEKPSDQLEMTLSYGGTDYVSGKPLFLGTIGVRFTNFSLRNIFSKEGWGRYLPQGDGQQLGIRAQLNGLQYQSYTFSFNEPWLGGKKPNSFTFDVNHSRYSPNAGIIQEAAGQEQRFISNSIGISLGKRLSWPDDYFNYIASVRMENYYMKNYQRFIYINSGTANLFNLSFSQTLLRSSIDNPIFPRTGSTVSLTLTLTPPYSLFSNKNYDNVGDAEKYKWMEYHKWRFKSDWYKSLGGNFVFRLASKMGYVGYYNKQIGAPPLERYQMGGDGLQGGLQIGTELIALRGYDPEEFVAYDRATIFNKYQMELRYLVSPNPASTAYILAFADAGNTWSTFKDYNPFDLKRTVGAGFRIQLPMFGLLGLDYGFGLDKSERNRNGNNSIWGYGRLSFMLGFEPE